MRKQKPGRRSSGVLAGIRKTVRPMGHLLDERDHARIVELFCDQHLAHPVIARRMGLTTQVVRRHLERQGLMVPYKYPVEFDELTDGLM